MFAHRGRGGPSRSTSANIQCQKCLKRGHYSYECKASALDRPYVSRPSRSQQLRNPKLVPKLTDHVLEPLEKKKGVADEEIAKREAERAKKRQLEDREDESLESTSKRQRSVSSDSTSTVSTNASRPPRRRRGSGSVSAGDRHGRPYRGRDDRNSFRGGDDDDYQKRPWPHSLDTRDTRESRSRRKHQSRSPEREFRRRDGQKHRALRPDSPNDRSNMGRGRVQADDPPRERSLSPFSKRLAMTRDMSGGGR